MRTHLSLAAAALVALTAAHAAAGPVENKKMKRQISIFERVVDQVLIDSPNFLVQGRDNARGVYIEEFGVLVSFEASLLTKDWINNWSFGEFEIDEDGNKIIFKKGDKSGKKSPPEPPKPPEPPDGESEDGVVEKLAGKSLEKQRKLYDRGKQEIIDALLEYGDTMTSLRDDQWVAIAAFLRESQYFLDNKISRLLVKARLGDIRAYTAGRLNEEAVAAKVVVEEY
jgi:hypothetical protein